MEFKVKYSGYDSADNFRRKYFIICKEIVVSEFYIAKVFADVFEDHLREKGMMIDDNAT